MTDTIFQTLTTQWREETECLSSTSKIVSHPAYQDIIGLGPPAIPLILREMQKRPGHWFAALRALTGANPVTHDQRGRMREMTEAWLRWGRDNGHI